MTENCVYIQFYCKASSYLGVTGWNSSFTPLLCLNLLVSTSCIADVFSDFRASFAHSCIKKKKLAVWSMQYSFAEAKLPNPLTCHSHLAHLLLVRNTLYVWDWDSTQVPGRSLRTWIPRVWMKQVAPFPFTREHPAVISTPAVPPTHF